MIDTHSHFNTEAFNGDLKEVISKANSCGVDKLVIVGFDRGTNHKALELSKIYDFCYPTYGIHPSNASKYTNDDLVDLEEMIKNNKCVAVGECGLDYYWTKENKEDQKNLFVFQIELSIKYNKPLVIHMRDASEDCYEILKQYPKAYGVMHGFSGSVETMNKFINLGFYIALGGPVTFKNAVMPKQVALNVPLDKLVLETDCPYLTPMPHRGKRNESSYIRYICEEIASIKGIPFKELDDITSQNAIKLFNLR